MAANAAPVNHITSQCQLWATQRHYSMLLIRSLAYLEWSPHAGLCSLLQALWIHLTLLSASLLPVHTHLPRGSCTCSSATWKTFPPGLITVHILIIPFGILIMCHFSTGFSIGNPTYNWSPYMASSLNFAIFKGMLKSKNCEICSMSAYRFYEVARLKFWPTDTGDDILFLNTYLKNLQILLS